MRKHGIKTILLFLIADGEASWSLLPSSVFLPSGGTMQPENIHSIVLVILAFPRLLMVYFSASCSYFLVSCCPSESFCNPQFNSVQLGLFFG